jgi:hypothetical protein
MRLVAGNSGRNDNGDQVVVHFMTLGSMGKVYIVDIAHHIRAGKYANVCSLLSRHVMTRCLESPLSVSGYKRRQNVLKDMNKRSLENGNCEVIL